MAFIEPMHRNTPNITYLQNSCYIKIICGCMFNIEQKVHMCISEHKSSLTTSGDGLSLVQH